MAKILITGVTGFIGSQLAKKLVEAGNQVYGITRHCASRSLKPLEEILDDITLINADVADYSSILQALSSSNPDYIIHLAALSPVRLSFEKPFEYEKCNILATMNVIHALLHLPDFEKRKLLVASTAEVYGCHDEKEKPLKETSCLNPSSPYAVSKAAADMYVRMASDVYGIDGVVLRSVNTYGRKYETNFIIEYIITSMLTGKKLYIGAPDSVREYIYVDDHVDAYFKSMEKARKGNAYNIATGIGITNRRLAEIIAERIGYDKNRISFGTYPPGYPSRPIISDQPYILLDSEKAKNELEWIPRVELETGLQMTINYWEQKLSNV
jgi:dTDP-glucose 4,6-dehydratase